jgi:hypothetical protein
MKILEKVAKAICNATGEFDWDKDIDIRSEFMKEAKNALLALKDKPFDFTGPLSTVSHGSTTNSANEIMNMFVDAILDE